MTNEERLRLLSAVYKCIYQNSGASWNVIRKQLVKSGKISKSIYSSTIDSLIALGTIVSKNGNLELADGFSRLAVLQKEGDNFYVLMPDSKKHLSVPKDVASGYKPGDLLDVALFYMGNDQRAIILGRSSKTLKKDNINIENSQTQKSTTQKVEANSGEELLLGRVVKISHDQLVFIPNKKSVSVRQIPILNKIEKQAAFQDKICVMKIININTPLLGGEIVEVKGDAGNTIHEFDAIAESYGAIMDWSGLEVQEEISKIPSKVNEGDLSLISEEEAEFGQAGKVVDLRHLPFSTVDPATCKDMDDAIYSHYNDDGDIVCYTAVANVTKYVDLDSNIGHRYLNGGFTIYAPNKAYNILPTQLSTGICSLNPNEDRLAFVVKSVIDKTTGQVKSSKIYDAIIKSRHKYSYEQAQEIVDSFDDLEIERQDLKYKCMTGEPLDADEQVLMNYFAGEKIKYGFEQRKMIRFVSNKERDIVFDDDLRDIIDIKLIPHLYYHEVIEAFMITANECTAKYAKDNNLDNIFRVHDAPNPRRVDRANEFFNILGVDFDGDLSPQGMGQLIDLIRDTDNEEAVNKFLIKMQSRAKYSDHLYNSEGKKEEEEQYGDINKISHYALQSPHYSHTTSPIRRVPDYITQFNILASMHKTTPITTKKIKKIIEIANQRQLDVDQAEKDFSDISSVIYCEKHIGDVMSGRVTKIRYTSAEEGYNEEFVVIVKNEERGVSVEIPLSQIVGRKADGCTISEQGCAVYDVKGNVILTLCKPVEFIIEKADRLTMTIVGRTNKELIDKAEKHQNKKNWQQPTIYSYNRDNKNKRAKRINQKNKHHHAPNDDDEHDLC